MPHDYGVLMATGVLVPHGYGDSQFSMAMGVMVPHGYGVLILHGYGCPGAPKLWDSQFSMAMGAMVPHGCGVLMAMMDSVLLGYGVLMAMGVLVPHIYGVPNSLWLWGSWCPMSMGF